MSAFSRVEFAHRSPPETVSVPPSAFAPAWPGAPQETVSVGVTLLSESDLARAKSMAAEEAWRLYPRREDDERRIEAMTEALVRLVVAYGTCAPDDVTRPWDLWGAAPEDTVQSALTVDGVKFLFDAIERLAIARSPAIEPSVDDVDELWLLAPECLPRMPKARADRVRRLMRFCVDELTEYEET